jgi:hypothetical protein
VMRPDEPGHGGETMICTRCEGTGFLNWDERCEFLSLEYSLQWISENPDTDMQICDCCGDGEQWYGEAGRHYGPDDPQGPYGPYDYNGGLCECH